MMLSFKNRQISRRRKRTTNTVDWDGIVCNGEESPRQNSLSRRASSDVEAGTNDSVSSGGFSSLKLPNRSVLFSGLIITVGMVASTLFLGFGISGAEREQRVQFDNLAVEVVSLIQTAWKDYETAALWLYESCRSNNISRREFREVYEYLANGDIDVKVSFDL